MTQTNAKPDTLPVAEIITETRSRPIEEQKVEQLARAIKKDGLFHSILIWAGPKGPTLVAGAYRLAAFKLNGERDIPVRWSRATNPYEAKVHEVKENLVHFELSALDRARHLYDWKQVYEAQYPETKHGARGGQKKEDHIETPNVSFSEHAGEALDLSRSSIKQYVQLWNDLTRESIVAIEETYLADHKAHLLKLAQQTPTVQQKVLRMLFPLDEKPTAENVPEALEKIKNGRVMTHVEKRFSGLKKTLNSLEKEEFAVVLAPHKERILEWVSEHYDLTEKK